MSCGHGTASTLILHTAQCILKQYSSIWCACGVVLSDLLFCCAAAALRRLLVLQVWDIHSKKAKCDLPGHADEVYTVDWSPDGASIASGGKDQVLKLWRH